MKALSLLTLLASNWIAVNIYGGSVSDARALATYLGSSYEVRYHGPREQEDISTLPAHRHTRPDRIVDILVPDRLASEKAADSFVGGLREKLTKFVFSTTLTSPTTGNPPVSRFLCVPLAKPGATSYDLVTTFETPLTRQVAREAAFPTLDLEPSTSFAQSVADAIVDQKIEKKNWRLVSADSQQIDEGPAANAIDGRLETYWHTQYDPTTPKHPHEIVVDMGQSTSVEGFRYVPRQDGGVNGRVKGFAFYLSDDGKSWGDPALKGDFPNTSKPTRVRLDHPRTARYFRFVALSEVNKGPWASAAEIDVLRSRK